MTSLEPSFTQPFVITVELFFKESNCGKEGVWKSESDATKLWGFIGSGGLKKKETKEWMPA